MLFAAGTEFPERVRFFASRRRPSKYERILILARSRARAAAVYARFAPCILPCGLKPRRMMVNFKRLSFNSGREICTPPPCENKFTSLRAFCKGSLPVRLREKAFINGRNLALATIVL
jgi:hypothetical protein